MLALNGPLPVKCFRRKGENEETKEIWCVHKGNKWLGKAGDADSRSLSSRGPAASKESPFSQNRILTGENKGLENFWT